MITNTGMIGTSNDQPEHNESATAMPTSNAPMWNRIGFHATRFARRVGDPTCRANISPDKPAQAPPAPAWYDPNANEMTIVASELGVDVPPWCNLHEPADRLRNPVLAGALIHEAAHSAHTLWTRALAKTVNAQHMQAAMLLEEARCERQLLRRWPRELLATRACAAHVVLDASDDNTATPESVGTILALILPRAEARIFHPRTVASLREYARKAVTQDGLNEFEAIWLRALETADDDADSMLECGRDWVEATRRWLQDEQDQQDESDGEDGEDEQPQAGGTASGNGDAGADTQENGQPAPVALPSCGCGTADTADEAHPPEDAEDGSGTHIEHDDAADAIRSAIAEAMTDVRDDTRDDARERVGDPEPATRATGKGTGTSNATITYRRPGAEDHSTKATIVRRLKRQQYRKAHRTSEDVNRPAGGRMSGTKLMQLRAQQHKNQPVTAKPWTRTRLHTVDKPPLHVGIVADLSGSMNAWGPHISTATWALAHAVRDLGGSAAACGFSGNTMPLLEARTTPNKVPVLRGAGGGSTGGPNAITAVAEELGFARKHGAKVIIVLTDGALPDLSEVHTRLDSLNEAGVPTVWAMPTWGITNSGPRHAKLAHDVTPDTFAAHVTDACGAALAAATTDR